MKKKINTHIFLNIVGCLLIIGFAIRLGADYYQYRQTIHSAPFDIYILERTLEFLLPSVICFIIAVIIKRKRVRNELLSILSNLNINKENLSDGPTAIMINGRKFTVGLIKHGVVKVVTKKIFGKKYLFDYSEIEQQN